MGGRGVALGGSGMLRRAVSESDASASAPQRWRVPHTLVLLFSMIVVAYGLTLILPQGEFERATTAGGKEVVVPGSYRALAQPLVLPLYSILFAIPQGLGKSQEIIFFVFIIGGALAVIRATGTIDAFLGLTLRKFGHRPGLLIAAGMGVFAVGSSTLGMAEEYIPFVPILLGLCVAMNLDAVTAIAIIVVGYGVGYGAAAINPFTVVVAQEIAGVPPTSGAWFRIVLLVPFWLVGFHHVYRYSRRVAADRSRSVVADIQAPVPPAHGDPPPVAGVHLAVLALTVATIAFLVYGISTWHWYLKEMGAMFLGLTLVVAIVGRLGADAAAKSFAVGASELTTTALLIGFARAIKIILEDGKVIDTIIDGVAAPLASAGPELASVGMFVFQSILNFFIPSGSGQAYVTMPIMAPLADLTHVPRQVAVLAYQFGDGLTNMLVPTNPVLVGILGMGAIPWDRWVRFLMPLMVKLWALCAVALVIGVWIGYS